MHAESYPLPRLAKPMQSNLALLQACSRHQFELSHLTNWDFTQGSGMNVSLPGEDFQPGQSMLREQHGPAGLVASMQIRSGLLT